MANKYRPYFARAGVVAVAITSGAANAALVTTDITAAVTDASTAGAAIGIAVLVMIVGMKVFKWVRRAL